MARAEIEVNVTGNLLPIARALHVMDAALRVYGHRWSEGERATIDEAIRVVTDSADAERGHSPDLDGRAN